MTPRQKAMKQFLEDIREYEGFEDWNHADVAEMVASGVTTIGRSLTGIKGDWENMQQALLYTELMDLYLAVGDEGGDTPPFLRPEQAEALVEICVDELLCDEADELPPVIVDALKVLNQYLIDCRMRRNQKE